jgi:GABA permease
MHSKDDPLTSLPHSNSNQTLRAALKPRHIAMISLGGIIGAGLFVGSSAAIAAAGPATVFSYALAGGLVFFIIRMLGEMAYALPQIRTFTEYTRAGLGNWAGFLAGWLYWYFWVIVVAVEAIAGATMLTRWINLPPWQIASVLLAAMLLVNVLSVRSYGEFEYWFSSLKVGAIIAFLIVAGFFIVHGRGSGAFANLFVSGGIMPHGILSVLGAIPVVIFSITGAEVATIAAAESAEPARQIAAVSRSIVVRVLTFYVASIFFIVVIVPWPRIIPGESPFLAALETIRVPYAPFLMSLLILVAVLSCLNSGLYVASRILFELAHRSDAPAGLNRLTSRGVPLRALFVSSVAGLSAIVISYKAPSTVFKFLIDASGCIMLVVYLFIALAQFRLRTNESGYVERAGPARMRGFPWLTYAVVASTATILVAMAYDQATRSQFFCTAVLTVLTLIAYWVKRQSRLRARLNAASGHREDLQPDEA